MADENFSFSHYPNYLEWYKCYDDPARVEWIDGTELRNHPEWDFLQKAKWSFFYRPVPSMVGRPQQGMIRKRKARIYAAQESLEKLRTVSIIAAAGDILAGVAGFVNALSMLVVLTLLLAPLIAVVYWLQKRGLEQDIETCLHEIVLLRSEIDELRRQIPERPSAEEIERCIQSELLAMECKCLSEVAGAEVDETTISDLIKHDPIVPPFRTLLIKGWGFLQPSFIAGPFGKEGTGIGRVRKDLGAGLATWRKGSKGQPIFRVAYLQFIYLLGKNINVYGFFYDCISRRKYGTRNETFQYDHVTNYVLREVELEERDWMHGLGIADSFLKKLFGQEVNAFSLAVASGSYIQCVLADESVVDTMNDWLKTDEKIRNLEADQKKQHPMGEGSSEEQRAVEELQMRELLRELTLERDLLAEASTPLARKVLQQVRLGIDMFNDPGSGSSRAAA